MDNSVRQLRQIVASRIPQISGEPRSAAARNVSLVPIDWFHAFANFLLEKSPVNPGRIENGKLQELINSGAILREGQDFEAVEGNVYEVLVKVFGGGPQIQRPFLPNPLTQIGRVVMKPIKLKVIINGEEIPRTVDPDWTGRVIKVSIVKHLKLSTLPEHATLRDAASNGLIPDGMDAKEIVEKYGNRLYFDSLDMAAIEPSLNLRVTAGSSRGSSRGSSQSSTPSSAGKSSTTSSMRGSNTNTFHSLMVALMQSVASAPQVAEKLKDDDSEYAKYVREGLIYNVSHSLVQNVVENSSVGIYKHFEIPRILGAFVEFLDCVDLFKFEVTETMMCTKCKKNRQVVMEMTSLSLDFEKKLFRKAKLEDCLENWKKKARAEYECTKCKVVHKMKGTMCMNSFPTILTFCFKRQREASGKSDINIVYPVDLTIGKDASGAPIVYQLFSVIAFYGHILSQKYKTYVYKSSEQSWFIVSESRLRPIETSLVIGPNDSACVLFYVRKYR